MKRTTRRSLLAGHRPRRRVVNRQDGQAGRAGLCSRSPAEPAPSASTAQVSAVEIPGRPSWRATARTCAQGARWRNQPSTCGVTAVPTVMARRCPERLTAHRPVLLAGRMLARNKFLYSFSRPAGRAACGRPRPAVPPQPPGHRPRLQWGVARPVTAATLGHTQGIRNFREPQ